MLLFFIRFALHLRGCREQFWLMMTALPILFEDNKARCRPLKQVA
jgi:hypothetical protein